MPRNCEPERNPLGNRRRRVRSRSTTDGSQLGNAAKGPMRRGWSPVLLQAVGRDEQEEGRSFARGPHLGRVASRLNCKRTASGRGFALELPFRWSCSTSQGAIFILRPCPFLALCVQQHPASAGKVRQTAVRRHPLIYQGLVAVAALPSKGWQEAAKRAGSCYEPGGRRFELGLRSSGSCQLRPRTPKRSPVRSRRRPAGRAISQCNNLHRSAGDDLAVSNARSAVGAHRY